MTKKKKTKWEPKKTGDLKVNMKFHDTNPRVKGCRILKIRELRGGNAICDAWYHGQKKDQKETVVKRQRLLRNGHRGYKYAGM
jgi:hypothetical protein